VNPTNKIMLAVVLGTLAGFLAIAGGFLAWADVTNFSDREGSVGMALIFAFAPFGGIVFGALCGFLTYRISKSRSPG
jgi:Na+/glutamate symporter